MNDSGLCKLQKKEQLGKVKPSEQDLRKPYEMDVFIYKKSYIYIVICSGAYHGQCDKLRDALSENQFMYVYNMYQNQINTYAHQ